MRTRLHVLTLCTSLISTCCVFPPAFALDLQQAYQAALASDPTYASARASYAAVQEKLPQGFAGLLPVVSFSGSRTNVSSTLPPGLRYPSDTYALQLVQPLFRWGNWQTYQQAKLQVEAGKAQFGQGLQDLILRVAQAYFDLLTAQDSLAFLTAQKASIAEQLESAQQNYKLGLVSITDTDEAQARYELAEAQRLAAQSDVDIRDSALQQIIGGPAGALAKLPPTVAIPAPQPAALDAWTDQARNNNLTVVQAAFASEIAQRGVQLAQNEHYPSVDLVASVGRTRGLNNLDAASGFYTDRSVGVQLTVPIFAGLGPSARVAEASALSQKSRDDLEAARRAAVLNAQMAYQGVTSGLVQIRALEAAHISNQKALVGNKAGYEVGVRRNIDVLNAQQQLYSTERDLAKARYDALMSGLKLKAAAGILSEDDVVAVNQLLR